MVVLLSVVLVRLSISGTECGNASFGSEEQLTKCAGIVNPCNRSVILSVQLQLFYIPFGIWWIIAIDVLGAVIAATVALFIFEIESELQERKFLWKN